MVCCLDLVGFHGILLGLIGFNCILLGFKRISWYVIWI